MAGEKVLVMGATGQAGICLLRELMHRRQPAVAFVRNPSKIPDDLKSNPLLSIVEGQLSDYSAMDRAMTGCKAVLSLVGPLMSDFVGFQFDPTTFQSHHRNVVLPLMRQKGIRRILVMSTITMGRPDDHWSLSLFLMRSLMRVLQPSIFRGMKGIMDVFEHANDESDSIDWTVYRIGHLVGEPDNWKVDRDDGDVFVGSMAGKGWTWGINRSLLTRWMVDMVEVDEAKWVGQMPAVSRLG